MDTSGEPSTIVQQFYKISITFNRIETTTGVERKLTALIIFTDVDMLCLMRRRVTRRLTRLQTIRMPLHLIGNGKMLDLSNSELSYQLGKIIPTEASRAL